MARISSTPCRVPSSPGRPCNMLRATSGSTVVSTVAMSRPTSMRVTLCPRRRARITAAVGAARRMLCHSDPLDLPLEIDAGMLLDAPAHRLAQRFDVGGGGAAEIDQKIAVHRRYLRVAHLQAAAARRVDE